MPDPNSGPEAAEPQVTTIVEPELRPTIEPYAVMPTAELPPGVIGCRYCGNVRFRRSRLRFPDLRELFLLRFPLRCMRCNQRQYGWFLTAALAMPAKSHGTRISRGNETWQAWTDLEDKQVPLQRPVTTLTSRATRLSYPGERAQKRPNVRNERSGDDRGIW